jgi:hypothetical protein
MEDWGYFAVAGAAALLAIITWRRAEKERR